VDPYLLDLRKFIKDPLINNNILKTDILIAKFFPKIKIVDFSNIKKEVIINQRALNISFIILAEEINKLIKSLLNRKVLKPNSIPNEVFIMVILVIVKDLAEIISNYFINGIIPKSLKEFIIIVLRKGKKSLFPPKQLQINYF